jgi:hypothetical protein
MWEFSKCQYYYPIKEYKGKCPDDHIPLRTSPRKKRNNGTVNDKVTALTTKEFSK